LCWQRQPFAAGTVPGFALTPQFDKLGKLATGCKLYVVQAGTVAAPQNAYQDTALTNLQPNPMTCDATGRLPQWFVADGNIKLRLTDKNGIDLFVQDNLLVIGPSGGGGGGGGTVDPTTILATGDFKDVYNTGFYPGSCVVTLARSGTATSGATERANADTSSLFVFLWNADANLAVSGGRGANAAVDFAANKTMTLPDCRGRGRSALADMGNSDSGRVSVAYFGCTGLVLGCAGGSENTTLTLAQLPTGITATGTSTAQATGGAALAYNSGGVFSDVGFSPTGSGTHVPTTTGSWAAQTTLTGTATVTSNNTSGTAHRTVQPTILVTTYIKL
jgi:microcystin-dependent protein